MDGPFNTLVAVASISLTRLISREEERDCNHHGENAAVAIKAAKSTGLAKKWSPGCENFTGKFRQKW